MIRSIIRNLRLWYDHMILKKVLSKDKSKKVGLFVESNRISYSIKKALIDKDMVIISNKFISAKSGCGSLVTVTQVVSNICLDDKYLYITNDPYIRDIMDTATKMYFIEEINKDISTTFLKPDETFIEEHDSVLASDTIYDILATEEYEWMINLFSLKNL